jgi:hypothetical protein
VEIKCIGLYSSFTLMPIERPERLALQPQNFNSALFLGCGHHRKSRQSGDERFLQRVIVMSSPTTHPSKWT